ncbi:MAG TPA: hypothetical protein VGG19_09920 [Tepidisphaeraceae bacterium]|jgi:hypothetical protein
MLSFGSRTHLEVILTEFQRSKFSAELDRLVRAAKKVGDTDDEIIEAWERYHLAEAAMIQEWRVIKSEKKLGKANCRHARKIAAKIGIMDVARLKAQSKPKSLYATCSVNLSSGNQQSGTFWMQDD